MDMTASCVVCGKKAQDYAIECYCCGNYYCSDSCKEQYHQKRLFPHSWSDYKHIYDEIMAIDQNIRLVTISDIDGEIKYSDHRQAFENLLTPDESKKSLKLAINSWKIRSELVPKVGKGKYVLAAYEKIKRITEPEADHSNIISRIEDIVRQKQLY